MESSTASEKKKLKRRENRYWRKRKQQTKSSKLLLPKLTILLLSLPSAVSTEMVNMEGPYGSEWAIEEKVKRREMVAPEARYIFVCRNANDMMDSAPIPLLGFLHYRFTLEEEMPVLYLYELQLDSSVQGKGLGKFLMELIELIAQEKWMSAVVLTVQKSNSSAMKFYRSKLRYVVSSISPSRVNPFAGVEKKYEILCKTFDHEAKAVLEVKKQTPCQNCFQYHLTTLKVLD
ncbi:N-alpha-acetyltransferase 40-like isoform X4 [Hibiscus syriacus]|uniref:N-alpha-acetyltransferase 40-like isoform X4 n=1 Tax=Hibiscus syriacus TaxID=106335 RepID=UPI001924C8D1|nr:N-alpha-acetyltransferase 40-like isoform X4 [Hibiscus syriacus]